jgi:hypothetical protein
MNDRLAVSGGAQRVPALDELGSQLGEVVDLAVEDRLDLAVLVEHRLGAAADVDDAQPPHAQGHAGLDVQTVIIGPAMLDGVGHGAQGRQIECWCPRVTGGDTADTTHSGPS